MENSKLVGEMYGILISLEKEYHEKESSVPFERFLNKKILKLKDEAFEWLIEDKREKEMKIAQEF